MPLQDFGFSEDLEVYDFGQDNLAELLDEGINDLNDETFGDLLGDAAPSAPVGRDFDFAASTSRFLGTTPAAPTPPQPPQPPPKPQSPWTTLDADPLLSRHAPPQPPPPPQRAFRTVDEIEAEMRAATQLSRPTPPLPPAQGHGPPAGRPLTLEEVEADLLRRRGAPLPPPVAQTHSLPLGHQQPAPSRSPFQPFGAPPPPPGYPPLLAQHQLHHARTGSNASPFPPPMGPGPPPMGPGPGPPGGAARQASPAPPGLGMRPPPPGSLATLFPPLPSQAPAPAPTPAMLEQQLQYLTQNQHAQHPSLTGAQLHALLQQAQASAAAAQRPLLLPDAAGEDLIRNVEQRIREHEVLEAKRKRKAAKIAGMAKHNGLMSNSDKDFITRIQVSQLVTDDPYADDFYFHVMSAIRAARTGAPLPGPGGPPGGAGGPNSSTRRPTRRENAMNRMAQNVQRLVDSAKQRNKSGQLSLDGALGKIALRTRSAPRQLLQVTPGATPAPSAGHALLAGLISHTPATPAGAALTHRAVLAIVEQIYDAVLELEQMRRVQPQLLGAAAAAKERAASEDVIAQTEEAVKDWEARYAELAGKLWVSLRVMEPLDSSNPHPFIALLSVMKGKRILPRALRHLSQEQTLTLVTLILATFDTLDTVVDAPLLDSGGTLEGKQRRAAVEAKTEVFLHAIISPLMAVIGSAPLRMVTGMLGLLMERNDLQKVVRSKPGIAFLTILLSRAEGLNQATPPPDGQEVQQWQQVFTQLFTALSVDLPGLFPSTRAAAALPFGPAYYLASEPDADLDDEPVWRFLAAVAVCADPQEQQSLVVGVRDKVLEAVRGATKGRVNPELAALKIRNCNLLLHSLGLDSSQLTVD